MIKLKKLTISNFMSFGKKPTEFLLDTGLSTLILGRNEDNGSSGYSRNGVGKSTMFQAVCYVLFGDSFSNIRQDDFINIKNKKKMLVTLDIDVNGDEYIIKRGRKPLVLSITKNGDPFTLHSAKNEDEALQQLLGMDLNIFLNTVMLTNNVSSFMHLKPTAQKQFFESLIKIDLLSERTKLLKVEQKDISVDIKLEEQNKLNVENNNNNTEATIKKITDKSDSWELECTSGIKKYQEELNSLESVDIESELEKIQELEHIEDEMKDLESTINSLASELEQNTKTLEEKENEFHYLSNGECPYCKQSHVDESKCNDIQNDINNLNDNIDKISEQLLPFLEKEETIKVTLDKFLVENGELLSVGDCQKILHNIDKINDKISSIKDDSINPYVEQIELLKSNITEYDYTTIHELTKLESHYKTLVKLLSDSKSFIRKNIVEQYVPFFNTKCNEYLEKLESPNRVIINNDLTTTINYMHTTLSFGNLSTGEKIRLSFALSLTFNDFLSVTGSRLNILFIDEIFDSGIDASGIHQILKLLKDRDESSFLISHRDEIIPEIDEVLTLVKKGGFTTVL